MVVDLIITSTIARACNANAVINVVFTVFPIESSHTAAGVVVRQFCRGAIPTILTRLQALAGIIRFSAILTHPVTCAVAVVVIGCVPASPIVLAGIGVKPALVDLSTTVYTLSNDREIKGLEKYKRR